MTDEEHEEELLEDRREEEEREEEEHDREIDAMDADPYSDDEKDQMGSSEFFNDND